MYLAPLTSVAIDIKLGDDHHSHYFIAAGRLMIIVIFISFAIDYWIATRFLANQGHHATLLSRFRELRAWLRNSDLDVKFIGAASGLLASLVLELDPPAGQFNPFSTANANTQPSAVGPDAGFADALGGTPTAAAAAARQLRARSGGVGEWGMSSLDGYDEGEAAQGLPNRHASLWLFLAIGVFAQALYVSNQFLLPHQRLGVLRLTVERMLFNDIATFMVLFLIYFLTFFVVLFALYPRSGAETLPQVPQFNDVIDALVAMLQLGFIGDPVQMETAGWNDRGMTTWQKVDLGAFIFAYFWYVVIAMILLLNLLIAMMGHTFQK
eukprot:1966526-Prymnesium_polylepis.1